MRPVALELRNFGCYRGPSVVSFDDLTLDVFAISGPTGSGKSTLLDAITWALYGQTARLGATGLNETLVTPGETSLGVILTFEAHGQTYRVTRGITKRKSGSLSDIKVERLAPDGTWGNVPDTDKIKPAESFLSSAIGLDYEGFVRSVLLPQGAFDEFLKGDKEKRRRVLASLLNTEIVARMHRLASERMKSAALVHAGLKARLEGELRAATPERRAELERERATLDSEIVELEREAKRLGERREELDRLETFARQLADAQRKVAALEREGDSVAALERKLKAAREAEGLAERVAGLRQREEDLAVAKEELESSRVRQSGARRALEAATSRADEAGRARKEREPELRRELQAFARAVSLMESLRLHGGRVSDAGAADGGAFDAEALHALNDRLARVPTLRATEGVVVKAVRALEGAEAALAKRRDDIARGRAALQERQRERVEAEAAWRAARDAYAEAELGRRAHALRQHLHAGGTCPVCAQQVDVVPEAPADAPDLAALEVRRNEREAAFDAARKVHERVDTALSGIVETLPEVERAVAEARVGVAEARASQVEALGVLGVTEGTSETIERALRSERSLQLARLARDVHALTHGADPAVATARHEEEIAALQSRDEAAGRDVAEARAALAAAEAGVEQLEKNEATARERLEAARTKLAAALAASSFGSAEEVERAALSPEATQATETKLRQYHEDLGAANAARAQAEMDLAGRTYDPEEHRGVKAAIERNKAGLASKQGARGGLSKQLEILATQLEQRRDVERAAAEAERDHETARTLHASLAGNGFQEYVLQHGLLELARQASVTIRQLTADRYELTLQSSDFYVRDTWQDTHERSVKTLSGGESFIVSLALALALSDIVAGTKRLGALFLDEGFGTLDAETLANVTDVLQNLSSSGRMVGVITHVTALTEMLPHCLKVTKSHAGSTVAWEAR